MHADLRCVLALLLSLGACFRAPTASIDAGFDAGRDASYRAGEDATVAAIDLGPPAPRARFAPRFVFQDPSVRCDPPPPYEMREAPRPRPPRGTVRWTYNPSNDPVAAAWLGPSGSFFLDGAEMVGMPNGGFVTAFYDRKFVVGVTGDGEFDFVLPAFNAPPGPAWLAPSTLVLRPRSDSAFGRSVLLAHRNPDVFPLDEVAIRPPVAPGFSSMPNQTEGPTVLPDGTIVWTPTVSTISGACADGRAKWVLEHDTNTGFRRVYADANGHAIVAGDGDFGIYRIDSDGNVLAKRDTSFFYGTPIGFSDRCGVVVSHGVPPRLGMSILSYFHGYDFSEVTDFPVSPYGATPTSDCGAWMTNPETRQAERRRADGSLVFTAYSAGRELADGSWLIMHVGDAPPDFAPGMTIMANDGTITYHTDFDRVTVGDRLRPNVLLTPDGVLYVTASSDVSGQQFAAIEVGIGPTPTWFGDGTNWAHDNATWHSVVTP